MTTNKPLYKWLTPEMLTCYQRVEWPVPVGEWTPSQHPDLCMSGWHLATVEGLPIFEERYPTDNRPRCAVEGARRHPMDVTQREFDIAQCAAWAATSIVSACFVKLRSGWIPC